MEADRGAPGLPSMELASLGSHAVGCAGNCQLVLDAAAVEP